MNVGGSDADRTLCPAPPVRDAAGLTAHRLESHFALVNRGASRLRKTKIRHPFGILKNCERPAQPLSNSLLG
jgi:hypothetical protein